MKNNRLQALVTKARCSCQHRPSCFPPGSRQPGLQQDHMLYLLIETMPHHLPCSCEDCGTHFDGYLEETDQVGYKINAVDWNAPCFAWQTKPGPLASIVVRAALSSACMKRQPISIIHFPSREESSRSIYRNGNKANTLR